MSSYVTVFVRSRTVITTGGDVAFGVLFLFIIFSIFFFLSYLPLRSNIVTFECRPKSIIVGWTWHRTGFSVVVSPTTCPTVPFVSKCCRQVAVRHVTIVFPSQTPHPSPVRHAHTTVSRRSRARPSRGAFGFPFVPLSRFHVVTITTADGYEENPTKAFLPDRFHEVSLVINHQTYFTTNSIVLENIITFVTVQNHLCLLIDTEFHSVIRLFIVIVVCFRGVSLKMQFRTTRPTVYVNTAVAVFRLVICAPGSTVFFFNKGVLNDRYAALYLTIVWQS